MRLSTHPLELLFGAALLALGLAGCTPKLGDKCVLSTDCSLRGDRACDTSQPGGYCTIRDCRGNTCPDEGVCVLFGPTVPGCGFDERSPSRTGRGYCMAMCGNDSDCRDGYVCSDPKSDPWSAVVLDDDTTKRVCIIPASMGALAGVSPKGDASADVAVPAVCGPYADASDFDAHSVYDAAPRSEAGTDAGDGGSEGGADAGSDADAGVDASTDADVSDAADAAASD